MKQAAVVTNTWVGCCQGRGRRSRRRRRKRRVMGSSGIMVLKSILLIAVTLYIIIMSLSPPLALSLCCCCCCCHSQKAFPFLEVAPKFLTREAQRGGGGASRYSLAKTQNGAKHKTVASIEWTDIDNVSWSFLDAIFSKIYSNNNGSSGAAERIKKCVMKKPNLLSNVNPYEHSHL